MPAPSQTAVAVVGIDIGKTFFHIVGLDDLGAIVLRQRWSRGQVEARFANIRRAWSGWKLAWARIISIASSWRSDTMHG
jgi:hypothetical protein